MGESRDFPETREAKPDRRGNVASAGLDPDDWDELEAWRVERRLSRSEATRRLIRQGLEAATDEQWRERAGRAVALFIIAGYPTAAAAGGRVDIAAGWLVLVTAAILFEPWISAGISRIPNPTKWL